MAIELGVGYLTVLPETSKLAPGIRRALGDTERSSEESGKRSGKRYGKGFQAGFEGMRNGALAVAAGLGAVVASSVNLEKKFSQTMNVTAATLGAPQREMAKLQKLALDLGASTSFSANEAADAMQELAKGGLSAATIQAGALEGTLQLAAAGGTSLASAAEIASNALNTFKLKGSDMATVSAALAGGANASTASVESLGQALGQVGPGALNAGLSLHDTVGALAAFDNAGIKGSDAGTSLKTMLARLVPQTAKAATAMKDANLDFTDANGNFLSLTEIAQQLQDGLGGLSEAQRTTALNTIFGSDATRAASVLMDQGSRGLGKYIRATMDQGAAQKAADARMKGTAGALERLSGAWETFRLKVGLALGPAVSSLANALGGLTNFLGANLDIVGPVAVGLGVMAAAILVVVGATWAWNAAIAANPIGLLIIGIAGLVAGLTFFFTKTKTGQAIVTNVWGAIRGAIGAVVGWWTGTAWPALRTAWNALATVARWLYNSVIRPVFNAIAGAVRVAWTVIRVIFVTWATIWTLLWKAVKWAWSRTGAPVFRAIVRGATIMWNWLRDKVFRPIGLGFRVMGYALRQVWDRVIRPVWSALTRAASAVWNWLRDKVFRPIGIGFRIMGLGLRMAYDRFIRPAWDGIRTAASAAWSWIDSHALKPLKRGVDAIGKVFQAVKRVIAAAWNSIKKAAAKPVNFVIEEIYTKGIKGTWDKIADSVGLDLKLPTVNPIAGFSGGGWTGNGSKYEPAGVVHADEFVVSKRARRAMERRNPGVLDYVNKHGDMPGYASGGLVAAANWWRLRGARLSEHPLFGGVTPGGHMPGSLHYSGNAVDLNYGPSGSSASEMAFFDRYMPLFKAAYPSMGTIWRAAGHYNHAHIDTGGHSLGSNSGGGSDGGIGGIISGILSKIKGLGSSIVAGVGKSPVGKIVGGLGHKLIDGVRDKISGLNPLAAVGGAINRGTAGAQVRAAALTRGWATGAQWSALDWLINKESGWNPNAANPTSSARGLFQKMTSIHGPVESTAFGQAKWGLNYIAGRYGNPVGAMNFHKAHGYYANGGRVMPSLFDSGGMLADGMLGVNQSGKPEAVLTSRETSAYQAMATAAADARRFANPGNRSGETGSGRKRVTVQIGAREFEGYMRELAEDAIDAADEFSGTTRRMG